MAQIDYMNPNVGSIGRFGMGRTAAQSAQTHRFARHAWSQGTRLDDAARYGLAKAARTKTPLSQRPVPFRSKMGNPSKAGQNSGGGGRAAGLLEAYAPAINELIAPDPRQKLARLQAKLRKQIANGAPAWKIDETRRLIAAVESQIAEQQAGTTEVQAWREGITRNLWIVTGLGVMGMVAIGVATYRRSR